MRLSLVFGGISLVAILNGQSSAERLVESVNSDQFANCSTIDSAAKDFTAKLGSAVKVIEFKLKGRGTSILPFPAHGTVRFSIRWIEQYRESAYPSAIVYVNDGRYILKCRDSSGQTFKSSVGDFLMLGERFGRTDLAHFSIVGRRIEILMVTDQKLTALLSGNLLRDIEQAFAGFHISLFARNDPWFYGDAADSSLFIFATGNPLDEQQYRLSKTLVCNTGQGCHLKDRAN